MSREQFLARMAAAWPEEDDETKHDCQPHGCGDFPAPCHCDDPVKHGGRA